MSVHLVPPVNVEPETVLTRYRVFELPAGTRHFCGYVDSAFEGRVSSGILSWDPDTMIGITRSGRRYRLEGDPGMHPDALYVWGRWKDLNSVSDYKDVTAEYAPAPGVSP
ncbi:hypothetical protein ACVIGB_001097 [Bradyrhizobium sp. USDA 4341]